MDWFRGLLVALLLCAGAVLLYLGAWWLRRDATDREGQLRRQTFEFQQGRVDGALNQLADVRSIDTQLTAPGLDPVVAQGLRDQRAGIIRQTCRAIAEINGARPVELDTFRAREC